MKLSYILAGALATAANAHSGGYNGPNFVGGRRFLSEMRARSLGDAPLPAPPPAFHLEERHIEDREIEERQTSNGRCGPGLGSCTNCCSPEGYCGVGIDYCAAPDCQFQYGPLCDANTRPSGTSTANVARPKLGSIPYGGSGIDDCNVAGQIAMTFDDGPYIYTSDLLDKLKAYNAKATFFITGNNLGKGPIDTTASWSSVIKRMIAEGHQVASHTWSHQDLSTLTATVFNNQMVYNEIAFNNILGYFPTYMRPPYSSCDNTCASRLKTLGYHITYFDLDTAGYLNDSPDLIQNSKNIWDQAIQGMNPATDNYLEIEHDIHYQTVYNLTDYILASMYSKGFKSVTLGDCLADPKANWYRAGPAAGSSSTTTTTTKTTTTTTTKTTTTPAAPTTTKTTTTGASTTTTTKTTTTTTTTSAAPASSQKVSVDGSCSATITCNNSQFGNCCSQYGWCGSTTAYCGAGCQPLFGTCTG